MRRGKMKRVVSLAIVVCLVVGGIIGTVAVASATSPDRYAAFVCPVFNSNSAVGDHNPNTFGIAEGHFSLLPGKAGVHPGGPVMVPVNATNADGYGSPPGSHSEPGETDYTAIWKDPPLVP
jgi:hypothetical protein